MLLKQTQPLTCPMICNVAGPGASHAKELQTAAAPGPTCSMIFCVAESLSPAVASLMPALKKLMSSSTSWSVLSPSTCAHCSRARHCVRCRAVRWR